jgi:hypothetical protein
MLLSAQMGCRARAVCTPIPFQFLNLETYSGFRACRIRWTGQTIRIAKCRGVSSKRVGKGSLQNRVRLKNYHAKAPSRKGFRFRQVGTGASRSSRTFPLRTGEFCQRRASAMRPNLAESPRSPPGGLSFATVEIFGIFENPRESLALFRASLKKLGESLAFLKRKGKFPRKTANSPGQCERWVSE